MMIEFRLDRRSGVPPYLQIVHQVKYALRLGMIQQGDQLPTVKEVVAKVAVNPNTVLKAYRELEHEGLTTSRPGIGTFVAKTLTSAGFEAHAGIRRGLVRWLQSARKAGLDEEVILALFMSTFRVSTGEEEIA